MRSRVAGIAVTMFVAASCAACTGGGGTPPAPPTAQGDLLPATPTSLPAFDPATFQALLAQLKGTPVVVNVWASWCGPCIKEAPALAAAAKAYEGRVQFVGVDILDTVAPAKQFIERFGWTYPSVSDQAGSIRDSMGLLGQPQTVFYDAEGKRVCVRSGPVDDGFLRKVLDSLLRTGTVSGVDCPLG